MIEVKEQEGKGIRQQANVGKFICLC